VVEKHRIGVETSLHQIQQWWKQCTDIGVRTSTSGSLFLFFKSLGRGRTDGWTRRTRSRSSDPDGRDGEDEARELRRRAHHSPALGLEVEHPEGVSSAAALAIERAHPLHDDIALNAPDSIMDDDVCGGGWRTPLGRTTRR
jgi:hypothetical protein